MRSEVGLSTLRLLFISPGITQELHQASHTRTALGITQELHHTSHSRTAPGITQELHQVSHMNCTRHHTQELHQTSHTRTVPGIIEELNKHSLTFTSFRTRTRQGSTNLSNKSVKMDLCISVRVLGRVAIHDLTRGRQPKV